MIHFATETGTSEAYAHRLHSLLERRGLDLPVAALDESAPLSDLELVVFVVSTTGDGQLPSSSLRAWTALRQASLPPMLLASLRFAIFGFGDSAYEHFNAAARKLRARLVQLGAKELCNAGAADDQGEPETLFNAWFIKHLLPGLSIDPGLPPSPVALPTRLYSVTAAPLVRSAPLPVLATVRANRRLTHADWPQDVRHIEFDAALQFSAGDVLYLTPSNVPAGGEVLQRFVRTKLADAADVPVVFSPAHAFIPDGVTPREACEEWLDVMGTPRAGFFECASFFCTDAEERERMLELAEGVGYSDYCRRELRSHAQVLLDFASCAIPFVWLAQLIGPIRPRAFSIASSPRFHAGAVHLTVAVVRHLTPNKRWRSGLCSTWLAALRPGDALRRVSVKPGALALPSDPGAPLILIGPGTGMAPMRSLLYDVRLCFASMPARANATAANAAHRVGRSRPHAPLPRVPEQARGQLVRRRNGQGAQRALGVLPRRA